ncbi:GNAT family N-acetyltransferase [Laceyella putida]|uniref:GNAT family N-acetyltransferase n=1 Tax=Laceyella putida TaxID=110101 RepID=A0ABW2RQ73_9BACL
MESIAIRRAQLREAGALTRLAIRSKAHWGYDKAFMRRVAEELTVLEEMVNRDEVMVAEREGRLLGFYAIKGQPPVGELNALFVDPAAMGQKVGRTLMEHALRAAREKGFSCLRIDSDPFAEGFYKKMGAVKIGEVPSGSIPGRFLPLLEVEI